MPFGSGGGDGGFTPVGCVLRVANLDVHAAAAHPCKWDTLWDDVFNANVLSALPSGLGMTASFDGSSETMATTVAGTWAFTVDIALPATDATWRGALVEGFGGSGSVYPLFTTTGLEAVTTYVYNLPATVSSGKFTIRTDLAAVANPFFVSVQLALVRLG